MKKLGFFLKPTFLAFSWKFCVANLGTNIQNELRSTSFISFHLIFKVHHPYGRKRRGTNSRASWWGWKEESEKSGLKLNIQKTKIMASSPITSWQIDGETVETVTDFIFLGSKSTGDGNCSHEIKRCLLLGRKAMTNRGSILKSRNITLLTNVCIVKGMVFPVVMYECETWTIKKAEHWRTAALELYCWRRFLRVLWIARRSNQSILKGISPEYSLEGLMMKLKLQYFGHLMWRTNSLEKIQILGKIEGRRRRGWQRMRWFDSIMDSTDMNLSKLWKVVEDREPGVL